MASSYGAAAASVTEISHKSLVYFPLSYRHFFVRSNSNQLSFRLPHRRKLRLSSKRLHSAWDPSVLVKAQLNKVSADGSSGSVVSACAKSEASSQAEAENVKMASEESISEFITQVSNLVKLVDSKDIVELKLKQLDCELLIRKKEALPQPPPPPISYAQPQPHSALLPPVPPPSPAPSAVSTPAPTPVPSPPKVQPSKSSHAPLKSPMAGTFYRSPGPGEPPFVKVGDKVKKGQVLCIIEAMKLMNEIEADQSGTIVEVLAEDGKPVGVDTPLFVIEP